MTDTADERRFPNPNHNAAELLSEQADEAEQAADRAARDSIIAASRAKALRRIAELLRAAATAEQEKS